VVVHHPRAGRRLRFGDPRAARVNDTARLVTGDDRTARAAEAEKPKSISWPQDGVFGTFDRKQLQRGLKVYMTVCAACHGLRQVHYRNLVEIGLTPTEAKAVAATKEVDDVGDDGQPKKRKADLKDRFVSPFPNAQAAADSNNGKAPPDLLLIVKAREGGANYVASLLAGYQDAPAGLKIGDTQHYNPYVHGSLAMQWSGDPHKVPKGGVLAMPPPLVADKVTYDDGTKATVKQESEDVAAFLMWAAEPHMEARKQMGFSVLIFLVLFSGLLYASYRRVWRNESH